jgi:hypothetical protein
VGPRASRTAPPLSAHPPAPTCLQTTCSASASSRQALRTTRSCMSRPRHEMAPWLPIMSSTLAHSSSVRSACGLRMTDSTLKWPPLSASGSSAPCRFRWSSTDIVWPGSSSSERAALPMRRMMVWNLRRILEEEARTGAPTASLYHSSVSAMASSAAAMASGADVIGASSVGVDTTRGELARGEGERGDSALGTWIARPPPSSRGDRTRTFGTPGLGAPAVRLRAKAAAVNTAFSDGPCLPAFRGDGTDGPTPVNVVCIASQLPLTVSFADLFCGRLGAVCAPASFMDT